jgi:hypothetical protein
LIKRDWPKAKEIVADRVKLIGAMFQLRDEHMRGFEGAAGSAFEERAVRHIRKHLPRETATMTDSDLRERVRRGSDRAKTYGFETEREIMCFVDTGFLLGERFDSEVSWTQAFLRETCVSSNQRAHRLLSEAEKATSRVRK